MTKNIGLIVNRHSKKSDRIDAIIERLRTYDSLRVHMFDVGEHESIPKMMNVILQDDLSLLIVAGGDGTVRGVIAELVGNEMELGIIPLGTTNNFARGLGLPLDDIDAATDLAIRSEFRRIDVGTINDKVFANVVGVGLSAAIANNVEGRWKKVLGRGAYALTGIVEGIKQKPFHVIVRDPDHELSLNFETRQLIIANGKFHAGKEIAADAEIDNGRLVVFAMGGKTRIGLLFGLLKFYAMRREAVSKSTYLSASEVEIIASPDQPVEIDGENGGKTPLRTNVKRGAVKVRY